MPGETLTERRPGAEAQPGLDAVREPAASLDLRGLTITTAIAFAAHEALAGVAVGDEVELLVDRFEALMPDLEAWCRATGHELSGISQEGETLRLRIRKGEPRRTDQRVAIVVSSDGLEELLSPLGFALAAALGGAQVSVYLQGPAVHVLAPGFRARLHGLGRPFSRFARAGLEKAGHVAALDEAAAAAGRWAAGCMPAGRRSLTSTSTRTGSPSTTSSCAST